jgi:hypothetical protein
MESLGPSSGEGLGPPAAIFLRRGEYHMRRGEALLKLTDRGK